MFFQAPPVIPGKTTPAVVAVFSAANITLDRALGYDLSLVDDDPPPTARKHAVMRSHAHFHKRENFYTGAMNPSAKTIPAGLRKVSTTNR